MKNNNQDLTLIKKILEIYDQKFIAGYLNELGEDSWNRELINRWLKGKLQAKLSYRETVHLRKLLPSPPFNKQHEFTFIDLFAGIGGIRKGFELTGGKCVFTSENDKFALKTYKANYYNDPKTHTFAEDIRNVTLSNNEDVSEKQSYNHIKSVIPDHDVLLAGFPCQPFSLAGVSKKNSLGKEHGFECITQGTLFFDVARILAAKKPAVFMLENVKNLKSHDKGNTFRIILETLDELGYHVSDTTFEGKRDPKIIDGQNFLPQHRERLVLVGFRRDLDIHKEFTLQDIQKKYPSQIPSFKDLLEKRIDKKYILTEGLWEYLYNYAKKHKLKGNGFGFGLIKPRNKSSVTRTLSARYHKDGSEILIDRGWSMRTGERNFRDINNMKKRPRRLTPRECARLMGFDAPKSSSFVIPVSDTQAYRQFGNSVVVPVFTAVAELMKPRILKAQKVLDEKNACRAA